MPGKNDTYIAQQQKKLYEYLSSTHRKLSEAGENLPEELSKIRDDIRELLDGLQSADDVLDTQGIKPSPDLIQSAKGRLSKAKDDLTGHLQTFFNSASAKNAPKSLKAMTGPVKDIASVFGKAFPLIDSKINTMENQRVILNFKPATENNVTDSWKDISAIASLYGEITADTRSASDSFQAITKNLGAYLNTEKEVGGNPDLSQLGNYNKSLSAAQDAVNLYVSSHKTKPFTQKGQDRLRIAKELQQALTRRQKTFRDRVAKMEETAKKALGNEDGQGPEDLKEIQKLTPNPEQLSKLNEIAKVQRHIVPVRMVPKNPEYQAEQTTLSKVVHTLGHGFVSVLEGLIYFPKLLAEGVAKLFKRTNKGQPEAEKNAPLIPGGNGERFKEYAEEELKGNIINDPRRIPIMWEKPIPEDPNQPPTVSFNFNQSIEGDDRTKLTGDVGHGTVTLRYSRMDPITGENTRYAINMGFASNHDFAQISAMASQYFNGLHVPGKLKDESDSKEYTASKTVTVTNESINKILLAAENYEKGGYNIIQRNCTTFVADMAKAGGIDLGSVVKEADFKGTTGSEILMAVGSPLLAIAGPVLSLVGKREVTKRRDMVSHEYGNLGQKIVTPQVMDKLWSAKHNIRARGYSPSKAAEDVRHEKGYRLQANKYAGKFEKINLKHGDRTEGVNRTAAIMKEIQILDNTLKKHLQKNEKDLGQDASSEVAKYCKTMFRAVSGYVNNIDLARKEEPVNAAKLQDMRTKLDATLNNFVDGLTDIYHNTFKSDENLYVPFSNLSSTIEKLREMNEKRFQTEKNDFVEIDLNRGNRAMVHDFLKTNCIYLYKQESGSMKRCFQSVGKMVALRQFGGTLSKGLETFINGHYTSGNLGKFAEAEKYFFTGKELSEKDYKLAFHDLPKEETELTLGNKVSEEPAIPSKIYQSEVYNRFLGNICPAVRQAVSKMDKNSFRKRSVSDSFAKGIASTTKNALSTKEGREAIAQIKEVLLPDIIEQMQKSGTALTSESVGKALNDKITSQIFEVYLDPMLQDMGKGTGIKGLGMTAEQGAAFAQMAGKIKDSPHKELIATTLNGISIQDKINDAISKVQAPAEVNNGRI